MSVGEYCALYLDVWSNQGWELAAGKPAFPTLEQIYSARPRNRRSCGTSTGASTGQTYRARPSPTLLADPLKHERKARRRRELTRINTLTTFYDALPRVRRALANVPTYMIFDDHDVTDDWNISRAWRDQVHTSPLGRRDHHRRAGGLRAVPGLGQRPARATACTHTSALLQQAAKLFAAPARDRRAVRRAREALRAQPVRPGSRRRRLQLALAIDGPKHRVVALDTRTRRVYRSRYGAAGLLSAQALRSSSPTRPSSRCRRVWRCRRDLPDADRHAVDRGAVIVPVKGRVDEVKALGEWRNMTGLEPDNEIWPGDDEPRGRAQAARGLQARRRALGRGPLGLLGADHLLEARHQAARPRAPRCGPSSTPRAMPSPALRAAFAPPVRLSRTTACA